MADQAKSLLDCLGEISDFRLERKKRHLLIDILCIAVCSVIANGDDWTDMEDFGKAKHDWFKTWLELPNGIPSHDTFRRVLSLLSTDQLQTCFAKWINITFGERKISQIAIDGKTMRSSGRDKNEKRDKKEMIHMVSAFAGEYGLVLGQLKNGDKSNEIATIPDLLECLDVSGATVTIDAMGCQKNIATKIKDGGGEYILALKDNHPTLSERARAYCAEAEATDFGGMKHTSHATERREHGRDERREYHLLGGAKRLDESGGWKGLSHIGWVRHAWTESGIERYEDRYYLVSGSPTVKSFSESVRGHWGIENRLHWVLDVAFREDDCRVTGDGAENLGVLRHIAINALREEQSFKRGIKGKRKRAAWDVLYLELVLNAIAFA